jgi:hypothetical protein
VSSSWPRGSARAEAVHAVATDALHAGGACRPRAELGHALTSVAIRGRHAVTGGAAERLAGRPSAPVETAVRLESGMTCPVAGAEARRRRDRAPRVVDARGRDARRCRGIEGASGSVVAAQAVVAACSWRVGCARGRTADLRAGVVLVCDAVAPEALSARLARLSRSEFRYAHVGRAAPCTGAVGIGIAAALTAPARASSRSPDARVPA